MKRFPQIIALALLLVATGRSAEFPAAWQHVQTLRFEQRGLLRVDLPAETIDAAEPNQRDVRLLDDTGREVPFVIERMPVNRPLPQPAAQFQATLEADATVVRLTTGSTQLLAGVTLETPAPDFLKPVTVEGSADGRAWTRIAAGEPFFRQFGASRLQLPLDGRTWPQLRLTLDNRKSPPIPVTGARLHPLPAARHPERPIAVEIVDREEAGTRTRLTLRLGLAGATIATLKLQTPEPLFTRAVSLVTRRIHEGEIVETTLARGAVFRLTDNGAPPAGDAVFAVDAVVPAREAVLVVENGDNPPLAITGASAGGYPVVLTFHTGERGVFHLLSGNRHAVAPGYDLALMHGQLRPAHVSPAAITPLVLNPAWRAAEALPGLDLPGTAIRLDKWRHRKPVTLAAAGVQQLELDLEVLARAAPDFSDLRLVRDGRQLPYLVDRAPRQRHFAPVVTRVTDPNRPTTSIWELQLPHRTLPLTRLECATTAALFQRRAELVEERRDDRGNVSRVRLGAVEWVRAPGSPAARLGLEFLQPPRTDRLRLEVENGDNPPLELTDFTCWHTTARLLFKAGPGAETFLYYGNAAATAPRYDLQLVAHQMLSEAKIPATLGGETTLRLGPPGGRDDPAGTTGWIFWAVLAAVVVALLAVLAKLLPKPAGDG